MYNEAKLLTQLYSTLPPSETATRLREWVSLNYPIIAIAAYDVQKYTSNLTRWSIVQNLYRIHIHNHPERRAEWKLKMMQCRLVCPQTKQ